MNSSGWDDSWGIALPGHLADESAHQSDDPSNLTEGTVGGIFGCQTCGKQYTRHCDLNKHLKTHIRPFRCPVKNCRYHTFGWPTEKELDRHYNDKHSPEPRTFSCLWPDCDYTSKRESNCKQHMEKTHGYHYVRSRAANRDEDPDRQCVSAGNVEFDVTHPDSTLGTHSIPDVLLTPSPMGLCSPMPPDSMSPMGFEEPHIYGTDIYSPWVSPVTTLRDNEIYLDDFPRAGVEDTAAATQDSEWLKVPVDPRLYNTGSCDIPLSEASRLSEVRSIGAGTLRRLPAIITPRTSPTVTSQILTPVSEASPVSVQESNTKREATTPRDARPSGGQAPGNQGLGVTQSGRMGPFGKRHVRFARDQGDDSDGGDEPPMKRMKTPGASEEDNGDPKMICPFRKANPGIYDLNVHSKYWSCHTEHHNISTVVRHLGRPAHNLEVDNARQAISSFNVTDNEHGHPAAGLCKKCWRSFTDRETFENHFRTKCETASRSKREKFQILLDTFCRTPGSSIISSSSSEDDGDDDDDDEPEDDEEGNTEARGPAPPSTISATRTSQLRSEDVVSRREYLALVERVATLERIISNARQQSTPRTLPNQQATVARAFTASPAMGPQAYGYYAYDTGPSPTTTVPGRDPRATGTMVGGAGQPVIWGRPENASPIVVSPRPQQPAGAGLRLQTRLRTGAPSTVPYEAANSLRVPNNTPTLITQPPPPDGDEYRNSSSGETVQPSLHQQHQQSTNTIMRTQWEQPVQLGEQMMERVNFFSAGQHQHSGGSDELTKFLNLDSQ